MMMIRPVFPLLPVWPSTTSVYDHHHVVIAVLDLRGSTLQKQYRRRLPHLQHRMLFRAIDVRPSPDYHTYTFDVLYRMYHHLIIVPDDEQLPRGEVLVE